MRPGAHGQRAAAGARARAAAAEDYSEAIGKLLLTVELDPANATVEALQEKYGLQRSQVDQDFGVVPIDLEHRKYAVMVDEDASARLTAAPEVEGPFANPRIEPFGPPAHE